MLASSVSPSSHSTAGCAISVHPTSGAVGAEVRGVDLKRDLSELEVSAVRQALLDHGVIFFRDQSFDAEEHTRLARRFGDIFVHPFLISDVPGIVNIVREPGDTRIVGEDWHSDTTMMQAPPMGAILYANEVPDYGGDTLFASQYAAYDALSDGMKTLLEPLRAVHSDRMVAGPAAAARSDNRTTKARTGPDWTETVCTHPVIRTHPETGRKCLFVNHSYTVGFEGMTEEESKPLLNWLMEFGHKPEFTCRFRWKKGSVAFWDNRCTKHIAVDDIRGERRVMRRVQVAGDVPY